MCIGTPMRVVDDGHPFALCAGRGEEREVDMLIVGPQPAGTWVLEFHGVAQRVLDEAEARDIDAALHALEALMRGESDIDSYFADLVNREPELPPHLKGARR